MSEESHARCRRRNPGKHRMAVLYHSEQVMAEKSRVTVYYSVGAIQMGRKTKDEGLQFPLSSFVFRPSSMESETLFERYWL